MDQRRVIAVDFNRTLCAEGGPDPEKWGEPEPDAAWAMDQLRGMGYHVAINSVVGDADAIAGYLLKHGIHFDTVNESPAQPEGGSGKLNAQAYIDDRAVPYRGDWRQALEELRGSGVLEKSVRICPDCPRCPKCGSDEVVKEDGRYLCYACEAKFKSLATAEVRQALDRRGVRQYQVEDLGARVKVTVRRDQADAAVDALRELIASDWRQGSRGETVSFEVSKSKVGKGVRVNSNLILSLGNKVGWDVCQLGVELAKKFGKSDAAFEAIWSVTQDMFDIDRMCGGGDYHVDQSHRMEFVRKLQNALFRLETKSGGCDPACQCEECVAAKCQAGPNAGKPGPCPEGGGGGGSEEAHDDRRLEGTKEAAGRVADLLSGKARAGKEAVKAAASRVGQAAWGRLTPRTRQYAAKTYVAAKVAEHYLMMGFTKAREAAVAAARHRGVDEAKLEKVAKVLAAVDLAAAWTVNFPAVTALTGNPLLGKAASWVPVASLAYLTYSTARDPFAGMKAARDMVAQALGRGYKSVEDPVENLFDDVDLGDEYLTLLHAAIDATGGDLAKATKLAHVTYAVKRILNKGLEKGRGQPCKPGETAARTGCKPRGKPAGSGGGKVRQTVEEVVGFVRGLFSKGTVTSEDVGEVKDALLGMTVKAINQLKKELGIKASGRKAELAAKVSERALEKLREGTDGDGRPGGAGRAGRGGGAGGGGQTDEAGGGVAGEVEGPAAARGGEERPGDPGPARPRPAARVPATREEVIGKIDRFTKYFRGKENHQAADWMEQLKAHVSAVGTDEALAGLGPEKLGEGEDAQYVGWADMGDFSKAYLARNGITLAGEALTPGVRAVSAIADTGEGDTPAAREGDVFPKMPELRDKLEESRNLPGLESSEDLGVIMGGKLGDPVTHLNDEVIRKLDQRYGEGKWIVKTYADDAYAGHGIYFPQRARQLRQDAQNIMWNSGSRLSRYGFSHLRDEAGKVVGIKHEGGDEYRFGTDEYVNTIKGDARHWADQAQYASLSEHGAKMATGREGNTIPYMAQPAFPVIGVSEEERARGVTFKRGQEGRVHVVTRNGKAELVPHSTWLKEEHLPVVFESDETRAMAQAAVDAINALPESERAGQIYAPDIVKTADGYRVVEANPSNITGPSGYLQDNPMIIDAYVSHLTGREPAHVAFIRNLLTKRQARGRGAA